MRILGISAFYHDSAAALVRDGEIIAAAQEERFTRIKNDAAFPGNAIAYCLREEGIGLEEVDYAVFYDKPFLKFERLLETYLAFAPRGFRSFQRAMPVWLKEKLFQRRLLARELARLCSKAVDWQSRLLFTEHHLSHAASAFYPSPFEDAAILVMDGVGEWATTSCGWGKGNQIALTKEIHFPHSLGLLYSAFTAYCGFAVNSGEYKLMGLAPYGEPKYRGLILDNLLDLRPDGSFHLNLAYFDYCTGSRMTSAKFDSLFGGPPRESGTPLTQRHKDLAASIQAVLEEAILRLTRTLARETGARHLCLAGGVALNAVANGRVLRDGRFEKIWIQPAAGDAGGALGAALAAWHGFLDAPRTAVGGDAMKGALLGPSFPQEEIEARLTACGARFAVLTEPALLAAAVEALASGRVVGWFQGRMEFGPRALGARSILADPRSPTMRAHLNGKVKEREGFRPFAPSVLEEEAREWFELDHPSPYMQLVSLVAESHRDGLPAVTHVDGSARVQTAGGEWHPRFAALLRAFRDHTGCPVLLNTSFNINEEPLVATPEQAYAHLRGGRIDVLAIGDCLVTG